MKNPAAGGGRWVAVAPGRFPAWTEEFARRHGDIGPVSCDPAAGVFPFTAADGAVAECHPPFPPVTVGASDAGKIARDIAAHAVADRTVGVLLVRLGGYAVGVFAGSPPVLAGSRTGSRPVHGRSAAGGWSQHRFARRREKQASEALEAAADAAVAVLGQYAAPRSGEYAGGRKGTRVPRIPSGGGPCATNPRLDAVVLGGDRRAVAGLRDDPRLAPYLDLAVDRFLTVPDPRLAVLRETPRAFQAIRIRLTERESPSSTP
ncbi:MAG TPA: acVLRF1 family peptidyl-tRNA hydrolase [Streptosporangiaceae bacterium]